jgi:hypothetical protein
MESAFSTDFSDVRVHTGAPAERLNRDLHAHAFTHGTDIYFNAGQYQPDTDAGKHLLAHELTHVVQQSSDTPPVVQRDEEGVDEAALEQCIAEQGGSPGYRDGGLASPEELARYREECLRRQRGSQSNSRAIENLRRAWEYAKERLDVEVRNEVENLFSPASLVAMAAFAALWVGSQFTPVGWVADAFALTLLTLTVLFVGLLVFEIARDLLRFFSAVNATTEDELRESGHALARALARGGVAIFIALLTRGVRGAGRGARPPTATAPATVEVVATTGVRVRVPVRATTVGEAVDASRLQQLASYAVMVPPPGGHTPDSPSSSSSGGGGSGSREPARGEGPARESGGGGATGAAGLRLTRIPYGEGPLSSLAQQLRLKLNLREGGNIAVFEFENIPARFKALVRRLGGDNVLIEENRMAVQNVARAAHSEDLGHQLITSGRNAGMQLRVRQIYTEYNPCTDSCLPLIREQYPNTPVSYSFIWERWGRETPQRNAAVDALFNARGSGNQK